MVITRTARSSANPSSASTGSVPAPVSSTTRSTTGPNHWIRLSLEEATHPVRTVSYGILKPGPNLSGGVPYVRVINMRRDRPALEDLHCTSPEIASKYERAQLKPSDVLISIRG